MEFIIPRNIPPRTVFVGEDGTQRLWRFYEQLYRQHVELQAEMNTRLNMLSQSAQEVIQYYESLTFHQRYPLSRTIAVPTGRLLDLSIARHHALRLQ